MLALDGDVNGAANQFADALEAFGRLAPQLEVAQARAVFARVVGLDHPIALEAATKARSFLEEVGAHQILTVMAEALPTTNQLSATGT